jgi:hypothetical protein
MSFSTFLSSVFCLKIEQRDFSSSIALKVLDKFIAPEALISSILAKQTY